MQLECECTDNILEQDHGRYSSAILAENWITAIWEQLHSCNSTLQITANWKPLPCHKNNVAIMEVLTMSGYFLPKDLKEINQCRR
jgi:hypothetical protein